MCLTYFCRFFYFQPLSTFKFITCSLWFFTDQFYPIMFIVIIVSFVIVHVCMCPAILMILLLSFFAFFSIVFFSINLKVIGSASIILGVNHPQSWTLWSLPLIIYHCLVDGSVSLLSFSFYITEYRITYLSFGSFYQYRQPNEILHIPNYILGLE